jgi:hypothetical protein
MLIQLQQLGRALVAADPFVAWPTPAFTRMEKKGLQMPWKMPTCKGQGQYWSSFTSLLEHIGIFLMLNAGFVSCWRNSPTEESMKVAKPKIAPRTGLCFVHLVGSSLLPGPFRMKLSCQESVLHLSWQQA